MSIEIPKTILQYTPSGWKKLEPRVATEAEVALSVNGEAWLSFSCTPTNLPALALGFLYNEGIIRNAAEVASAHVCAEGTLIDVWLNHAVEKPTHWQRTSGCTGGFTRAKSQSIQSIPQNIAPLQPGQISSLMRQLFDSQEMYHASRGIHCAALGDESVLHVVVEDIGRHNTMDKLAGMLLLHPPEKQLPVVLTTGRVSSEMLQKAARIQAEVVISHTAPTHLSVRLAQAAGITLIGYARAEMFNIYTHPQRVAFAPVIDIPTRSEIDER